VAVKCTKPKQMLIYLYTDSHSIYSYSRDTDLLELLVHHDKNVNSRVFLKPEAKKYVHKSERCRVHSIYMRLLGKPLLTIFSSAMVSWVMILSQECLNVGKKLRSPE